VSGSFNEPIPRSPRLHTTQSQPESRPRKPVGSTAGYSADITAGSLKLAEGRIVAELLLKDVSQQEWRAAIVDQNILKASRPSSAIRVARLVRKRLEPMGPDLWKLVRDGSGTVAAHASLAAAIKHSRLLGDFLDLVVREQHRAFATTLPKRLWDEYLLGCRGRDSAVAGWSESTCRKCGTVVYHILEQAGFIDNSRNLKFNSVHISAEVVGYLKKHNEQYVLRCMQVTP
jgi:hypothetical protein